jgi:hypothetical protein
MILYFALAIPVSAALMLALRAFLRRRGQERSVLFYAGLAHVLVGLPLLGTLSLAIGAGIIAAGAVLMVLGSFSMPAAVQGLLAVLPLAAFGAYVWYSSASSNVFLIPEGFKGRVLIVHSCEDGLEKELEGMRRVYRIPASGVLKTQFSFAGDAFDHLNSSFYYVDAGGNRTKLQTDASRPSEGVVVQGVWTLQHEQTGDTILDFIVEEGTLDDPRSYRVDQLEQLQSAIDSCRL